MHYFPSVSNIYYEIVHEVQKSKMKKKTLKIKSQTKFSYGTSTVPTR